MINNTHDNFEYICLDIAQKFLELPETYKISHMNKFTDDFMLKTVYTNARNINKLLTKYGYINIYSNAGSTEIETAPLHSIAFCNRLFDYFFNSTHFNSAPHIKIDIKTFQIPYPLYPLFIGIIHASTKEKQTWKKLRTQATESSLKYLDCIISDSANPNVFHKYDANILKPIYITILNYLFPDELFELIELLEHKIELTYRLPYMNGERYNFTLLKSTLCTHYMPRQQERCSFYNIIANALRKFPATTSNDIIELFKNESLHYFETNAPYRQYKSSHAQHTLEMLITELENE